MDPPHPRTKVTAAVKEFDRQKRQLLLGLRRHQAIERLGDSLAQLTLHSAPPQTLESTQRSLEILGRLDPQKHLMRVVPKGPRVKLTSEFGQAKVSFCKGGRTLIYAPSPEKFRLEGVLDVRGEVVWVTRLDSFRKFDYRQTSFQVGRFLSRSHFPLGVVARFDDLEVRLLPELPFSLEGLEELRRDSMSSARYLEVFSTESGDFYRVFWMHNFMQQKLVFPLSVRNQSAFTEDGVMVPIGPVPPECELGIQVSIPFQRVRLIKRLLELLGKSETGMDIEGDTPGLEFPQSWIRPSTKPGKGPRVPSLEGLIQIVRETIQKIESALFLS